MRHLAGAKKGLKLSRNRRRSENPLAALAMLGQVETYGALVATASVTKAGKTFEATEELCEVEPSAYGFPVTLKYAGAEDQSFDRASLEAALAKMLEHPDVGAAIARLIRAPAPTSTAPKAPVPPVQAGGGSPDDDGGSTPNK